MVKSSTKRYKNNNKNIKTRKSGSRSYKTKKTGTKRYKSTRNKKGGLLWSPSMTVAGVKVGSDRGHKQYNWSTGKWDELVCYGVGPLKGCKIIPAK
jgi:hypothetical protein